jgi:hypothetical protein
MSRKKFNFLGPWHAFLPLTFILASAMFTLVLPLQGAQIWNGPLFIFNESSPNPILTTNQDRITPETWLTRGSSGGLFNAYYETNATALSPADTAWAFGTLTNYASLPYTNWLAWLNGNSPTTMVGSNIVVHLISEDIYLSFKFSFWASKGAGGFTYQRSTPLLPVIFNSPTNANNGRFNFSYTAYPGTSYVVQSSTNLMDWLSEETNTAATTLIPFSEPLGATPAKFFRVAQ